MEVSGTARERTGATPFEDQTAFRSWYERSLPRVYQYLYHRCGRNPALAEELTQETFVSAVRSARSFRGEVDPVGWVLGIARHRLADHFRRLEREERRQTRAVPLGFEPAPQEPDDELAMALAALPAMQRAAISLHYLDDLPVREVGRLLGRSEKAVESLLSRGRAALRSTYRGADDGDER
jgi:RNA polymerase sigma-70 factor (ECF subfamily)